MADYPSEKRTQTGSLGEPVEVSRSKCTDCSTQGCDRRLLQVLESSPLVCTCITFSDCDHEDGELSLEWDESL